MATTTCVATTMIEQPKRTRKTHNKVRTGCQTCKVRRKKCDEAKPSCRRCTSTGRTCDGYETTQPTKVTTDKPLSPDSGIDVSSLTAAKSTTSSKSTSPDNLEQKLQLWRPPQSHLFSSEQDYYCFDFFRKRTGPEFAAYFDSSIWRTFMIRACFMHPTVLQAAMAVGAVHRRFELGISKEAFEFCDIATKQYRKAMRCLQEDMRGGHPNSAEINMVTSLLLSVFEAFQGNYDSALKQFSIGLNQLLRRNLTKTYEEADTPVPANVGYTSLHDFTSRLELQAPKLFNSPTTILQTPGVDPTLHPIPKSFTTLTSARDALLTEGLWIWDTWDQLSSGLSPTFTPQHTHIARLLEWSMAYAEYTKTPSYHHSDKSNRRAAHLLKLYREVLYLILLTQIAFHEPDGQPIVPLCFPPELCDCHKSCKDYAERKAALNAHFARQIVLSQSIFDEDSNFGYAEHSLSVDSGIGPPLYLGVTKCRSTKVRHQVTALLSETELDRRVWSKLGVYTIAEKLSSIEEHAVVQTNLVGRGLDPKWVDITMFLEEGRLLLRYCREDEWGGLRWSQEWIKF